MKPIIILTVFLLLLPIVFSAGPDGRTLEIGIIPNHMDGQTYLGFERMHNVTVDRFVNYFDINYDYEPARVRSFLKMAENHTANIALQVEWTPENPSPLAAIKNGAYDAKLYQIALVLKEYDDVYHKRVIIRPLPEFFGYWTDYGIYNTNNSREDFVPAYRRMVDVLRSTGSQNLLFDLNIGGLWNGSWSRAKYGNEPWAWYYPGDEYVDELSIDMYNFKSISGYDWISFYDLMKPSYDELAAITPNKPINVGETNSRADVGNKSQWTLDAVDAMIYNFTRMTNIDFFFVDYNPGYVPGLIDFNDGEEEAAFRMAVEKVRIYNAQESLPESSPPILMGGDLGPILLGDEGPQPQTYQGYVATYSKSDLQPIVVDGIGTFLAELVNWADIVILMVILGFVGTAIYEGLKAWR